MVFSSGASPSSLHEYKTRAKKLKNEQAYLDINDCLMDLGISNFFVLDAVTWKKVTTDESLLTRYVNHEFRIRYCKIKLSRPPKRFFSMELVPASGFFCQFHRSSQQWLQLRAGFHP